MHISEGVLSGPALVTGAVLAAGGVAIGLKHLDYDRIPQAGVLSAAFFVASLIHVPVGPASTHLVLNGLMGLLLGWVAFPAILVALLLQALLFQFGGLTTLGINTVNMALPAVVCGCAVAHLLRRNGNGTMAMVLAFACGFTAIFLSALMVAASLVFSGEAFATAAVVLVVSHLPVMVIEGVVTAFSVAFLLRVKPEILGVSHAAI